MITLQLCGHLVNQLVQAGSLVDHLNHVVPLVDVQQGGLVDRILHAVPRRGVHPGAELPNGPQLTQGLCLLHDALHGGLVDCLLHAVPPHGVHLCAELPIGQFLRHGGLVRILFHVELLHDFSLLLLLDLSSIE